MSLQRRFCLLATLCAVGLSGSQDRADAQADSAQIPLVPGLTVVLAAHNAEPPGGRAAGRHIARGDYDLVVAITGVDARGIDETTSIEAVDDNQKPMQLTIHRRVLTADLNDSRRQILGFHTDDPNEIPDSTSLGPSLAILRDLRSTGQASYRVMNFRGQATSVGMLVRAGSTTTPFPVLVNGRRVSLPAIRVTGMLEYDDKVRPWEQSILDDAKHPLTLRFAYGPVGAGAAFTPEFTREVVRIDFPTANDRMVEKALVESCRVEVPGVYFDFDRATLKPESNRALSMLAELLRRQSQWRLRIEGHTDNSGGDAYNQNLSMRRAAAVEAALVQRFSLDPARLTSVGFGAKRPVETNDTIAGRAHNRRVELVRDCPGKP